MAVAIPAIENTGLFLVMLDRRASEHRYSGSPALSRRSVLPTSILSENNKVYLRSHRLLKFDFVVYSVGLFFR